MDNGQVTSQVNTLSLTLPNCIEISSSTDELASFLFEDNEEFTFDDKFWLKLYLVDESSFISESEELSSSWDV